MKRDITITTLNPEEVIRILSLNGWEFENTANEIYIPLGEGADEDLIYSIRKLPKRFKTWKEYKDFLLENIHPDLKKLFKWQWSRFGDTDDVGANKYMVKRILLCDWEGNITWSRDFDFNYSKGQTLEKNRLKREDEIIQKWTAAL